VLGSVTGSEDDGYLAEWTDQAGQRHRERVEKEARR
jgi:hypothetical protein